MALSIPKNILLPFALLAVLSSGCVKDKKSYTLSGRIYIDCSRSAIIANAPIRLFQDVAGGGITSVTGGPVAEGMTDNNGDFRISYVSENSRPLVLFVSTGSGYSAVLENIPSGRNIQGLTVYYLAETFITVSLNVIQPFTANDTLYITDLTNPAQWKKVPGPLSNGMLYTLKTVISPVAYDGVTASGLMNTIKWKKNFSGSLNSQSFNLKPCDTSHLVTEIQ